MSFHWFKQFNLSSFSPFILTLTHRTLMHIIYHQCPLWSLIPNWQSVWLDRSSWWCLLPLMFQLVPFVLCKQLANPLQRLRTQVRYQVIYFFANFKKTNLLICRVHEFFNNNKPTSLFSKRCRKFNEPNNGIGGDVDYTGKNRRRNQQTSLQLTTP